MSNQSLSCVLNVIFNWKKEGDDLFVINELDNGETVVDCPESLVSCDWSKVRHVVLLLVNCMSASSHGSGSVSPIRSSLMTLDSCQLMTIKNVNAD